MIETMYHTLLYAMPVLAVIVFIALFFVKAGYGIFQSRQWGISLPNKVGWVIMECPAFLMMLFFRGIVDLLPSVRTTLLPTFVHFPHADERKKPDADCHYRHGSAVQRHQCFPDRI